MIRLSEEEGKWFALSAFLIVKNVIILQVEMTDVLSVEILPMILVSLIITGEQIESRAL